MNDTLRLVSTTDTPEQMQAAMDRATGVEPAAVVEPPAGDTAAVEADGAAAAGDADGAAAAVADGAAAAAAGVDPKVSDAARILAESKKSKSEERKSSIQAEIDRLSWQKHQRADEVAREEQRLAEIRAERARLEGEKPAAAAVPVAAPRPKVGDFDDYDQFVEALADWKADQKTATLRAEIKAETDALLKARDDRAAQSTQQQEHEQVLQAHESRVVAAAASIPDYAEVMRAAEDPQYAMPALMFGHLLEHERGPELAYQLVKLPPKEFRAIADLPPNRMFAALGRMEARLTDPPRAKAAPTTGPASAPAPSRLPPPPPKPVSGSSSASTKSPDQMTPAEYSKWRRANRAS